MDITLSITSVRNNKAKAILGLDKHKLLEMLSESKQLECTKEEYKEMDKHSRTELKSNLSGYTGAFFEGGIRKSSSVSHRNLITLDIDNNCPSGEELKKKFDDFGYSYIITSSLSHKIDGENVNKFHVYIICSENIASASEYKEVSKYVVSQFPGLTFDNKVTGNYAAILLESANLSGQEFEVYSNLDLPDFVIPNDISTIHTVTENTVIKRTLPSDKMGIEGAFCSVFTARAVFESYHSDSYVEGEGGRWTYVHGTTANGIVFYDNDEWFHSNHDSDPLSNTQKNAFQLYAYFNCNGDMNKAEKSALKMPEVSEALERQFEELSQLSSRDTQSLPVVVTSVEEWDSIRKMDTGFTKIRKFLDIMFLVNVRGKFMFGNVIRHDGANSTTSRYHLNYVDNSSTNINLALGGLGNLVSKDDPKKKIAAAKLIIDHHSSAMKVFMGTTFEPYNLFSSHVDTYPYLNTFFGYNYDVADAISDDAQKAIDWVYKEYIGKVLAKENEGLQLWIWDWITDMFKDPGNPKGTALVLYSRARGTGKSAIFYSLIKPLMGKFAKSVRGDRMTSKFNDFFSETICVLFDDVKFQARKDDDILRAMITGETQMIEKKSVDAVEQKSYIRPIITTNHNHAIHIDSVEGERRYTASEVSILRKEDSAFIAKLTKTVKQYAPEFLRYFMLREVRSNLRTCYKTALYEQLKSISSSSFDDFLSILIEYTYDEFKSKFGSDNVFIGKKGIYINSGVVFNIYKSEYENTMYKNLYFRKSFQDSALADKYGIKYDRSSSDNVRIRYKSSLTGSFTSCMFIPFTSLNSINASDLANTETTKESNIKALDF